MSPDRVGPFVVLDRLGAGGMGVVFAAYDERLDRKVAVKIPRVQQSGEQRREQLLTEARSLARLSHPHVVQVHEADTLPDGNVYLAMEYVVGENLRERQRAGAPWRQVLKWYIQAGSGLAAAHRAGVIHRDFKPDNLLMGEDDRVRVVDFGLSSGTAVAEKIPAESAGSVQRLSGTPGYIAPELFDNGACDERADQFSFCVALYEALYGERPYPDFAFVGKKTPQRRSRPNIALPRWLRRAIDRGLSIEPEHRFPSMAALLAELSRRRVRRSLVAAGASVLVAACVLFWTFAIGGDPCPIQHGALEGIWQTEQQQRLHRALGSTGLSYAETVWQTVKQTFDGYADKWLKAGQQACIATNVDRTQSAEALDLRMACLADRRRELQASVSAMMNNPARAATHTAEAISGLGEIGFCENVKALRLGMPLPTDTTSLAKVDTARDHLAKSRAALALDDLPVATAEVKQAKAQLGDLDFAPVRAELKFVQARLAVKSSGVKEGTVLLQRTIDQATASRHDELVADAWLSLLMDTGFYDGQPAKLRDWLLAGRASLERLEHQDDPRLIKLGQAEGRVLSLEGHYQDAANILKDTLEQGIKNWGKRDLRVASLHHDYANALALSGKAKLALEAYNEAIPIFAEILGAGHPRVGKTRLALGLHLGEQLGRIDDGLAELEKAAKIFRSSYGEDHLDLGSVLHGQGKLKQYKGAYREALDDSLRALAIFEKHLEPSNPRIGEVVMAIGVYRFLTGELTGALTAYQRALQVLKHNLGESHIDVGMLHSNIGEVYLAQNNWAASLTEFNQAMAIVEPKLGPNHPLLAYPLKGLGLTLLAKNQFSDAVIHLERAISLTNVDECDPAELAEMNWALARSLALLDLQPKRRLDLARNALDIYRELGASWQKRQGEIEAWLVR